MPQYDWSTDFSVRPGAIDLSPNNISNTQIQQASGLSQNLQEIPGIRQLSHVEGGRTPFDGSELSAYPNHVEEFLQPGFRSLDEAMKHYWSGIRVPTKDSYRFMRVKISGGDKSLLIWNDDLVEGRARMPLAAISREGAEFNPEKYSPNYLPMSYRYLSSRRDLVAKVYRPTPWLVNYKIIIWAEHKRDMEYILYQSLTRFNPLAEFKMSDGKIQGNVQLRFGGSVDASDKEAGYDQHAKVRYEISCVAEAWLPLPEKIVKTVIGRVTNIQESRGEVWLSTKSQSIFSGGQAWFTPINNVD